MSPVTIKAAIAGVVLSGISYGAYLAYNWAYENGRNACIADAQKGTMALVEQTNKQLHLLKGQRDSFRVALNERNKHVKEVEYDLMRNLHEIERTRHEISDACLDARIPSDYRRMLDDLHAENRVRRQTRVNQANSSGVQPGASPEATD